MTGADEGRVDPAPAATAAGASSVVLDRCDAASAEARDAISRYFAELSVRFPQGYEPDEPLDVEVGEFGEDRGAFVLLRNGKDVIGCGGIRPFDDSTVEIRRLWIDPRWRGHGLGRRLLEHLEEIGRGSGAAMVVLDTNESLTEAIAMYESSGYRSVERYNDNPYAHRWFAKDLAGGA